MWNRTFYSLCTIFQKKGKVPSTDFPLLWKFEVFFYIRRRGTHTLCRARAAKTLVQNDAYCGGDVHIIHTWVNGLHILIFSINLVKCRKPAPLQLLFLSANFWAEPSAVFPLFFSSVYNSLMIRHSINCPLCSKLNFPEIENSVRIV